MTRTTSKMAIIATIAISLMCCFESINSAATGYYYQTPISQFNMPQFSTMPSTGPFISIGANKVVNNPRAQLSIPPLPPFQSQTPTQNIRLQPTRVQPTQIPYARAIQQPQITLRAQQQPQGQVQLQQLAARSPQLQQQIPQITQTQRKGTHTYRRAKQLTPNTVQSRSSSQASPNSRTAASPSQKTSQPNPSSRPINPSVALKSAPKVTIPTSPTTVIPITKPSPSDPTLSPPQIGKALDDIYVVNGRQLHQYKVHEDIDNDIDQPVENFIPPNFFVSNYHAKIGPTHPLGDQFEVETRFGGTQPNNQQANNQQQQPVTNAIALGSGGLGFVRLPNGNVYLGSGSLGYISSLRRNQDVQEARTRIESRSPDALHFGHGPLTDSLIYQSN